jgi:hypothetical protein
LGNAGYPVGSTPISVELTGNTNAGSIATSLPAAAGKVTYLCGFSIFSNGETTATNARVVLADIFVYSILLPTVASNGLMSLIPPPFTPCHPASAGVGTSIFITVQGAAADGNTFTYINAWGFQQ